MEGVRVERAVWVLVRWVISSNTGACLIVFVRGLIRNKGSEVSHGFYLFEAFLTISATLILAIKLQKI